MIMRTATLAVFAALFTIALPQINAAEDTSYDGTWKWTSGRWSKNAPRGIVGTVTKESDALYKGAFIYSGKTYNIDMTSVAGKEGISLSGTAKVGKRDFSMTGTLAADGSIDAIYSNGKDKGWLKLSPTPAKEG